jgi:hypothetical protein
MRTDRGQNNKGVRRKKRLLGLWLAPPSWEYLKIQLNSIQVTAAMGGEAVSLYHIIFSNEYGWTPTATQLPSG